MLKRVTVQQEVPNIGIPVKDDSFPAPFASGIEYASPARGTWNIVHTGMLIPEAHEIFVCAASCLRGVVLTAAELGAAHRFSTVEVRENNLLDGDMEDLVIDGVSDV
ncbi:MAG: nitrogenase, partial [Oscillospiraceae bacterium]|nr:nitrogenase [Oscillospiraceae bacterium]